MIVICAAQPIKPNGGDDAGDYPCAAPPIEPIISHPSPQIPPRAVPPSTHTEVQDILDRILDIVFNVLYKGGFWWWWRRRWWWLGCSLEGESNIFISSGLPPVHPSSSRYCLNFLSAALFRNYSNRPRIIRPIWAMMWQEQSQAMQGPFTLVSCPTR